MPSVRRRIVVQKPGGWRVLGFDDTPIDDPAPGEVQVAVEACGINFADISVRLGLYKAAGSNYPICPGFEFAGVIRCVGADIQDYRPGDRVFGASHFGGYTTAINCPSQHLWPLPQDWDFTRGASFPVAYLTAYYGLHNVGHLSSSDKVLVHSAAGGVGTAMLHLLKLHGNLSVGVVGRPEKIDAALEAGAGFVIDKKSEDLWTRAEEISREGYDLILDANGASTLKNSYDHLRPSGRLVVYGFSCMFSRTGRKNLAKLILYYFRTPRFNPFDLTGSNKTVGGFNLVYLFDKADLFRKIMDTLLDWDSAGQIPVMPVSVYPFEEVVEAHKRIESGLSVGKLVLVTRSS